MKIGVENHADRRLGRSGLYAWGQHAVRRRRRLVQAIHDAQFRSGQGLHGGPFVLHLLRQLRMCVLQPGFRRIFQRDAGKFRRLGRDHDLVGVACAEGDRLIVQGGFADHGTFQEAILYFTNPRPNAAPPQGYISSN